ncbi:hypothetical protein HPB48_015938 [Haemaphysalis longicornis]|uniref:Thymidine kinase n=1 Tax=Haemaphysalis longicornis TaxID=44386 RepID=A0A9J6FT32_HAELO|nr:hypothetical protein HPB48_015938 [Haemaphysalis longicornis]
MRNDGWETFPFHFCLLRVVSDLPFSPGNFSKVSPPPVNDGTELMRRLKRYEIANHKCLIVKYAGDTRYDAENISTHDKQAMAAVKATTLIGLRDMMSDFRIIGIDEGQFGFPNILTLVPLSESVIKLSAVCMLCFAEAAYTKRRGCEKEVWICVLFLFIYLCNTAHYGRPKQERFINATMW